ncbi:hypothetical protein [Halococcus sediminicola]|uniref:hypothetical protein n=1 Tax=Halococcus sediminicola TaxID=1264579 RepID=UPI0012AC2255|nr:hypothetical protein [Halococcus sediminicola]
MVLNQLIESAEVLDNCSEVRAMKDVFTRLQCDRTARLLYRIRSLLAVGADELYNTETELVLG